MDPAQVTAELELGRRRRNFVLNELIEVGFDRESIVDLLVRLTGSNERNARALVEAELRRVAEATPPPRRDARLAENEIRFRERCRLGRPPRGAVAGRSRDRSGRRRPPPGPRAVSPC